MAVMGAPCARRDCVGEFGRPVHEYLCVFMPHSGILSTLGEQMNIRKVNQKERRGDARRRFESASNYCGGGWGRTRVSVSHWRPPEAEAKAVNQSVISALANWAEPCARAHDTSPTGDIRRMCTVQPRSGAVSR